MYSILALFQHFSISRTLWRTWRRFIRIGLTLKHTRLGSPTNLPGNTASSSSSTTFQGGRKKILNFKRGVFRDPYLHWILFPYFNSIFSVAYVFYLPGDPFWYHRRFPPKLSLSHESKSILDEKLVPDQVFSICEEWAFLSGGSRSSQSSRHPLPLPHRSPCLHNIFLPWGPTITIIIIIMGRFLSIISNRY